VEVYETEQEQIEAIKKWWKENGKSIIIGVILGLASLVGWQQWQANVKNTGETASLEYDVLLAELDAGNYQSVKDRGAHIIQAFQSTPYANLTALALAKAYMEEADLVSARTYLQMVIDQKEDSQLQEIARLRMGRLLLADGQAAQALTLVSGVDSDSFAAAYSELRGDIHVALGNTDQARQAYKQALEAIDGNLDDSILKMKLDDLGGPEAKP
jgi:FimV-like protein